MSIRRQADRHHADDDEEAPALVRQNTMQMLQANSDRFQQLKAQFDRLMQDTFVDIQTGSQAQQLSAAAVEESKGMDTAAGVDTLTAEHKACMGTGYIEKENVDERGIDAEWGISKQLPVDATDYQKAQARLQQLKYEEDQKELAECTFKPDLTKGGSNKQQLPPVKR